MDPSSLRRLLPLVAMLACSRPPALQGDPRALVYRSRSKVPDTAARQMAAAADAESRRRAPWREPNHLHAAGGPIGDGRDKYLFGETQLYLGEYEPEPGKFREVDPKDDAAMAYADALFTVQQLQRWARRHDIAWDVQLGRAKGRVGASGADSAARKLLSDLSGKSGLSAEEAEMQRPRLDDKYRDRR
jgi:hypothetical protein